MPNLLKNIIINIQHHNNSKHKENAICELDILNNNNGLNTTKKINQLPINVGIKTKKIHKINF